MFLWTFRRIWNDGRITGDDNLGTTGNPQEAGDASVFISWGYMSFVFLTFDVAGIWTGWFA